jgi:hypothetical protein
LAGPNQSERNSKTNFRAPKMNINQNYFLYNTKYFKPMQGTAMGSPLSSILAEIFLQYFEELMIKHWMETGEITYCRRYGDVIINIFDPKKT